MAHIIVCDFCGKSPAAGISIPIGSIFNGIDSDVEYKHVDVCLIHSVELFDRIFSPTHGMLYTYSEAAKFVARNITTRIKQ